MALDHNPLIHKDYQPVSGWALLLFGVALVILVVAIRFLIGPKLAGHGPLILFAVIYGAGLGAVILAVLPMGWSAIPALALRPAGWKPVVFGVVGTLVLSIAASQLGPELKGMEDVQDIVRQPHAVVPSILVLGILAPLVEELIFRGLLYGWLEGRWGWRVAFIVSSLAFAAAHYQWGATGWYRLAYAAAILPLGLLFGWLRRRTDSLLPSFASHVINNSFAVLAAAYLSI